MHGIKVTFDEFRKEIKNIKSASDLTHDNITALWAVAIFSTIEFQRQSDPDTPEELLFEMARMTAMKHFDLALLDSYGVRPDEFE